MDTNFVLNLATIGLVTVAIINRIKAESSPTVKSYVWTIISFVIGAGLYLANIYAPAIVIGALFAGLIGSGIYDIYKKQ